MELVYGIIIGIVSGLFSIGVFELFKRFFDNCFKKYYEKKLIEFVKGLKDEQ